MMATELERLRLERDTLEERLAQLHEMFGITHHPPMFGLRPGEMTILHLLLKRSHLTHDQIMYAIAQSSPDPLREERDRKIIQVYMHHIRRALEPHGIKIESLWGIGYRMPKPDKEALDRLIQQDPEAVFAHRRAQS